MTYDLAIGDRAYSSWSLRGWLLFDAFDIPFKTHSARLYTNELAQLLTGYFPGKTAPTMRTPDGVIVPETIAIAEELASRHPEAGLWPTEPRLRATARVLASASGRSLNRSSIASADFSQASGELLRRSSLSR